MKLNQLLSTYNVTATGFKAIQDLSDLSNKSGEHVALSTNSPSLMFESGIISYYAPVLPRDAKFTIAQDVIDADLDVNYITVLDCSGLVFANPMIVSRHKGTIDILKDMFPEADIFTGNVTSNDLDGKLVIGTLPPHLISKCKAYQAVTICDFDYSKDGDLSGSELVERMIICNPISVTIE